MTDQVLLSPDQISGLLQALSDPADPVRIAVLRALLRLPLDAAANTLLRPVLADLNAPEVTWTTFIPSKSDLGSILEIVERSEEEERSLARRVITAAESKFGKPGQESYRITARFARLALNDYENARENLLPDAEYVARAAEELGNAYVPDVSGLYDVYRVFLRRAASYWFHWVEESRYMYDPATQMPSYFSTYEGSLAVSRQIEWAVSRGNIAATLAALQPALKSSAARDRFAAAQLIEWSERTRSEISYWRFGGGSGPGDVIRVPSFGRVFLGELKSAEQPVMIRWNVFEHLDDNAASPAPPEPAPTASAPAPSPTAQADNTSYERQISFWIAERENERDVPLELGQTYHGLFRVGLPVADTLFGGADVIPDSAVPQAGLKTHWKILPRNLRLAAIDSTVTTGTSGEAEFDILIPKIGNSQTITIALTPVGMGTGLLALIFVGKKLYRELSVSMRVTDEQGTTAGGSVATTTRDQALARLGEADLRTTHEWTTPPGTLVLYVYAPGKATIYGSADGVPYPPAQQVDMGTEKAELTNIVDSLRKAAENLRSKTTAYLNNIDPEDLLHRLDAFQPQCDWAQLADFAGPEHTAPWNKVAVSTELQVLAFYGKKLYDTLFPADLDSRPWMDALPPGQLVHVIWRKESGASWIPHLPWELLYRGAANPGAPIDPTQFWGLRYRLQYTSYNPPRVPSASLGTPQESCCTNLLFFGNSPNESAEVQWQRKIWATLSGKIKSCLVPSGTINPKSEILKALTDPNSVSLPAKVPAAVLYLFCHYGKDPRDTPILRFGDTSNPDDILTEPEFGTSPFASRPLVFANACATAGTDIYAANVVTKAFFDRGCRAFIGTDCMVPAAMASRFAVIFFYFFLRQVDKQQLPMAAGEAVAQTRLFLWCHYRNIGGLLYSYLNQYELYMASDAEIRTLQKK
jgi:CHAT domain